MISHELHFRVRKGDLQRVRELLVSPADGAKVDVNGYDREGYTPLMQAVKVEAVPVEMVDLLLQHGADPHQESPGPVQTGTNVMALALSGGDPKKVSLLVQHGADIHYRRSHGYCAILDAVYGRAVVRDERLIDLLTLLIQSGVDLNGTSSYEDLACLVLSRWGRFDGVELLLHAGADGAPLQWNPLMRAVTLGSLDEVEAKLEEGAPLEERDCWGRTAWLLAVQTGDVAKAQALQAAGADTKARAGKLPLSYSIKTGHVTMRRWLLDSGIDLEERDFLGRTALMVAAEEDSLEALNDLLRAGADVDAENGGETALRLAKSREVVLRLLDAGADPGRLGQEGRRAVLGLEPESDESLLDVSPAEFLAGRTRRYGAANPEEVHSPFQEGMIRSGISAYMAAQLFAGEVEASGEPVWCADRFGQSMTFLPDGRIIQIGGEHEDYYDEDFCIYNDLFIHYPDGTIRIFTYPKDVFPPLDFHTATLIGEFIYVIGSLGYQNARHYGTTPVYRIDHRSLRVEKVEAEGEAPGWIHDHRADRTAGTEIQVSGGKISKLVDGEEVSAANQRRYTLDVERLWWTAEPDRSRAASNVR